MKRELPIKAYVDTYLKTIEKGVIYQLCSMTKVMKLIRTNQRIWIVSQLIEILVQIMSSPIKNIMLINLVKQFQGLTKTLETISKYLSETMFIILPNKLYYKLQIHQLSNIITLEDRSCRFGLWKAMIRRAPEKSKNILRSTKQTV